MTFDWLAAAQRLRAIAQTGLAYTKDRFDLERYEELTAMSHGMLATLLEHTPASVAEAFALEKGYPTPKIDVRTAVFSDGRVLLVKEWQDGLWTLPGGWADEHDTPRAAAEREVLEESGYIVRATRLVAVRDRRLRGYQPPQVRSTYKLIFLGEIQGGEARVSNETTAVDFFPADALPPLSLSRTLAADIADALACLRDPALSTRFD